VVGYHRFRGPFCVTNPENLDLKHHRRESLNTLISVELVLTLDLYQ